MAILLPAISSSSNSAVSDPASGKLALIWTGSKGRNCQKVSAFTFWSNSQTSVRSRPALASIANKAVQGSCNRALRAPRSFRPTTRSTECPFVQFAQNGHGFLAGGSQVAAK
jgi:hypothetical protein